jgi:hypothetical protein
MKIGRMKICLIAACVFLALAAAAQPPVTRDKEVILTGRLLDAETKSPIRDAVVDIRSDPVRVALGVATDAEGMFHLPWRWAGDVRVSLQAPGYTPLSESGVFPPPVWTPFKIPAGTTTLSLGDFFLMKGRTLTGILMDTESEKPISGIQVDAARRSFSGGQAQFTIVAKSKSSTGPDGSFTVKDLPPGDYVLAISSSTKISIDAGLPLPLFKTGDSDAGFVRMYWPNLGSSPSPWSTFRVGANPITELGRVVLKKQPLHVVPVSTGGFACDKGKGKSFSVKLQTPNGAETIAEGSVPCGDFNLAKVPTGTYRLEVSNGDMFTDADQQAATTLEARRGVHIHLDGHSPIAIQGKLEIDGAIKPTLPEDIRRPFGVWLRDLAKPQSAIRVPPVDRDGNFEVHDFASTYAVMVGRGPADRYYVKQITYRETALTNRELELSPGDPGGLLRVVLSTHVSRFDGQIDFGSGEAGGSWSVILVQDDLDATHRITQRITLAADGQGRVTASGLDPSTHYRAFALPSETAVALERPNVLDSLLGDGVRVTLTEGQLTVSTIPIVKPPAVEQ